ncbi:putative porin [Paraburkholderia caribensis]|nr:putative porin [Paraburkholderia caribensis]
MRTRRDCVGGPADSADRTRQFRLHPSHGKQQARTVAARDVDDSRQVVATYAAGGNYRLTRATLGLVLSETRLDNATSINNVADTAIKLPQDTVRFDNIEVNVRYFVTPKWHISAAYVFTYGRFDTPAGTRYPKWHQVGLLNTYFLSQRSDVYGEVIYQRANELEGTGIHGAQISNFPRASGSNQPVAAIGLRHRF